MKKDIKKPWLTAGYGAFANNGPEGLKIELLARTVGKNKSSFYHLFADLDRFVESLLELHLDQVYVVAEKEHNCRSQEELVEVLVEHKTDLLFNRQLRIHRERPDFRKLNERTNEIMAKAVTDLWSEILGLKDESYLAELVFKLSLDNFFMQISEETLRHDWLNNYIHELRTLVRAFRPAHPPETLDGGV